MTLSKGSVIRIPAPSAEQLFWRDIHIADLTPIYLHLIESALTELNGGKGQATWNDEGYYFAENGWHYWKEVAEWIADEAAAQGYISRSAVKETSKQELDLMGVAVWNRSWDCKSVRARKLFGWEPKQGAVRDEIPTIVRSEAERLRLAK